VLAAAQLLTPRYGAVRAGELAALFYTLRNLLYAAAAFPAGALADRMSKLKLLAAGYALGGVTAFSAAAWFRSGATSLAAMAAVFVLAGIYIGIEDTLEGAIPAGLVDAEHRGTAYGLMGAVNGVGDLLASARCCSSTAPDASNSKRAPGAGPDSPRIPEPQTGRRKSSGHLSLVKMRRGPIRLFRVIAAGRNARIVPNLTNAGRPAESGHLFSAGRPPL
jgi:hypothetical protein